MYNRNYEQNRDISESLAIPTHWDVCVASCRPFECTYEIYTVNTSAMTYPQYEHTIIHPSSVRSHIPHDDASCARYMFYAVARCPRYVRASFVPHRFCSTQRCSAKTLVCCACVHLYVHTIAPHILIRYNVCMHIQKIIKFSLNLFSSSLLSAGFLLFLRAFRTDPNVLFPYAMRECA